MIGTIITYEIVVFHLETKTENKMFNDLCGKSNFTI